VSEPSWYPGYLAGLVKLDRARHARRMAENRKTDRTTTAQRWSQDLTSAARQIRYAGGNR